MKNLILLFSSLILVTNLYSQNLITPIPLQDNYDHKKAMLGKKLFFDPRLSSDNTISCATCHQIESGGDDNLSVSIGIGGQTGTRNSPTVLNSRYNFTQFWDGRASDLFDQVQGPIHNPIEMGSDFKEVVKKLSKDSEYQNDFEFLYPDGITSHNISDAITEFEKALITPNSRFDQFLRGDTTALSSKEKEGFKAFKEYGCIGCHNGVNLGGNLFQRIGLLKQYHMDTVDKGRFEVTNNKKDTYVFKVPTLRNIELTAPYFHDGKVESLNEAVSTMIHYQIGTVLGENDVENIVEFLKTLTGEIPAIMKDDMVDAKNAH